ncbi:MAG: methyltransferase domain-containing protein [Actinobacteria bacterium]|nr:MAG: methyltransferase domain-containing protein [Actinomycetota bacterium]
MESTPTRYPAATRPRTGARPSLRAGRATPAAPGGAQAARRAPHGQPRPARGPSSLQRRQRFLRSVPRFLDDLQLRLLLAGRANARGAEPQAELARERANQAGVADLVEFRVADYRELAGEQFDAIASIGMVEHVGEERIDVYASRLASLLRGGGRLLNHGIAKLKDLDTPDEGPFSERFVFPDGVPLPLSRIELALERAGLVTRHVEGFADDYAETLTHWISRFESRYDDAIRLAGPERARVWRLYLHAARQGFETGWASIYQVLAHLPSRDAATKPAEALRLPTRAPRRPAARPAPRAAAPAG